MEHRVLEKYKHKKQYMYIYLCINAIFCESRRAYEMIRASISKSNMCYTRTLTYILYCHALYTHTLYTYA